MCCCCLTLGPLRSAHLTWSRFSEPPLFLGCCDASRDQTVTLRPSLVCVLLSCLQLQSHPPDRTMTPLKFSNHSISIFFIPGPSHPHTYFVRSLPFRSSVFNSSGLFTWVYPPPLLLIPCLQVGEGLHNTELLQGI